MLSILIATFTANSFANDKSHDCIHDEIDHQISQQFVKYNNHPLATSDANRRTLLQPTQLKPIRIRPYYDPLSININTLSVDKIQYIKSLVSTSINYLQQFVNVIPVDGPLFINRCERVWYFDDFTYNVCLLSDYTESVKCQFATIPDQHIAESWYYDPITFKSHLYKEAGSGVADADIAIYVSYTNGECGKDSSTLAWASTCSLDQYGRPISGTINFCPGALDTKYWKFDAVVTLHEIMHVLVMSDSLFHYFWNGATKRFYEQQHVVSDGITNGMDNAYIITPKVKEIVREHYDCDTLIGAALENNGGTGTIGSHWEGKYTQYELMCGTIFSAQLSLSYITLALMEDSGWYQINYDYAEPFTWGYHEGCKFINGDCVNKANSNSNFEQFWCTSSTDNGCSHDYSSIANCINRAPGIVPVEFRWYNNAGFGGPPSHDYCAFRNPERRSIYKNYEKICWDIRGNWYSPTPQYPSSSFAISSRCVEIDDGTIKKGYCFKHECIAYDTIQKKYNGVKIIISNGVIDTAETIICFRTDALIWKESVTYGKKVKCPNIDSICDASTRPFACYWGHYSDLLGKCICSVGYIGADCSTPDKNRFAIEATLNTKVIVTNQQYERGICITGSTKSAINGFYRYNDEYEGVASYHNFVENRYLYFVRYYSRWNIGDIKGDITIYTYCKQALPPNQVIDIEDCKLWQTWDRINGWQYDLGMNVFYCTPTYSPSTTDPTKYSTKHPTKYPTKYPTINPTINPTIYPTTDITIYPTIDPSFNPISAPTGYPTFAPTTLLPTIDPTFDSPTGEPTFDPVVHRTVNPSVQPTKGPTVLPTHYPTENPTVYPTISPTKGQTGNPTINPTKDPTIYRSIHPTNGPTLNPTASPSRAPTRSPTNRPSLITAINPTDYLLNTPTDFAIYDVTDFPTDIPSNIPTSYSTNIPSSYSTNIATSYPTEEFKVDNVMIIDNKSKENKSKENKWQIFAFTFIGIFIFVIVGLIFARKYYIKRDFMKFDGILSPSFCEITNIDIDIDNDADNDEETDGLQPHQTDADIDDEQCLYE